MSQQSAHRKTAGKAFSAFAPSPRPYELAAEIGRGEWVRGKFVTRLPVTVIHADRIQAFTCDVVGDRATGDVSFESPSIYKGRIVYKAARSNGQWRIIEMAIPSRSGPMPAHH